MPHERKIEGGLYIRVEHGKTKKEAQRIARPLKARGSARVIKEGSSYSVFRRIRKGGLR